MSATVKQVGDKSTLNAARILDVANCMYCRNAKDFQRPIFFMNQSGIPAAASAEAPPMRRE
jgi:hypothetical protein